MTDRTERAKRILEEPLIEEAFLQIEEKLMQTWKHASWEDVAAREQVRNQLRALEAVHDYFANIVKTGEFEMKLKEVKHG